MAGAITITNADRIEAENIMEQFLVDKFNTDADFSKGSALRDLAINAMAYTFAFLKKERDYIRARQSLLLLGTLTGTDVDDAVDEILSNWFITRKTGRKSRGKVTVYISQNVSVSVPVTALFYKTTGLTFAPDTATTLSIREEDLFPIRNSNGTILTYGFSIPVIATGFGAEYDIDPGPFADYTRFSPYIIRVENQNQFSGGAGTETTEEMLERSSTAVTERSLNSPRAIDAVLRNEFSDLDAVSSIGYGDSEMIRDLVAEEATGTRIHAGGCTDVFLRMPITEGKVFTGTVGGEFTDPRPHVTSFRDDTVDNFSEVQIGEILEIYNNAPSSEANRYVVKAVSPFGIEVSPRSAFPGIRPTVEVGYSDGSVVGGNAEFASTLHDFVEIEVEFTEDGRVGPGQSTVSSLRSNSYLFVSDDIGKWINITGSTLGNNGIWHIVAVNEGPNSAELRNSYGSPPEFDAEDSLDWDLLLSTDHEKFVRIYGSLESANNGIWRIQEVIDTHTVRLINAVWGYPSFTAATALTWQLCTKVVEYSVGGNSPFYNDRISRRYSGKFTSIVQYDGCVMLPGEPIYQVKDVSFADELNPYRGSDDRVTFPNRSNSTPVFFTTSELSSLEYQVLCQNPGESQSGWQRMLVDVGWPDGIGLHESKNYFNGKSLRVTYDTLTGYDAVWVFMVDGDRRVLCGSVIPRGLHPIYVSLSIRYSLSKNAAEGLDETLAKQALVNYIIDSRADDPVDLSDLMYFLRSECPVIGYIEPFDIYYDLIAPDGRVVHYKTKDIISLDSSLIIDPATGFIPNPGTKPELILQDPLGLGVSTNTVRYLSLIDLITFTQL